MSADLRISYRALTHTNVGWCHVTVLRPPGRPAVAVVRDGEGHLGPGVVQAARMVAAAVHREVFDDDEAWELVVVRPDGELLRVTFEQAFGGWYGRPAYEPLTTLAQLTG